MSKDFNLRAILTGNDKLSPVLKKISLQAKIAHKSMLGMSQGIGTAVGKGIISFAALSSALGATAFFALKKSVATYVTACEDIYKGAARTGMAAEEWQKLKYIAEHSGSTIQTVESSTARLNKSLADAAIGKNNNLAALMKQLGISMKDANGRIKNGTELLPQLSDAFVRNNDPVIRARMGMALFGRSWQQMMPLLIEGNDGLQSAAEKFDKFNVAIANADVAKAREFGTQLSDLRMVMRSLTQSVASNFIPILKPVIENITQWVIANKELISTKVAGFIKSFTQWIEKTDWQKVLDGILNFVKGIGNLVDMVGGVRNALIGLSLFMGAGMIRSVLGIAGIFLNFAGVLKGPVIAALKAVFLLMRANPIGLLITAVVGLGVLIYKNFDKIVGTVKGAWERIKSVFEVNFFAGLTQVWMEAWQGFMNGVVGIVKGMFSILPDWMQPDSLKDFKFDFADRRAAEITEGRERPSIVNAGQVRASGQIEVNFNNAPPGMRVEQTKQGGDVPVSSNVGYRAYALGAP